MELLTEILKLATALVLLAVAVLKLRSMTKANGFDAREDKESRDNR